MKPSEHRISLRRITPINWGWIHFKFAVGILLPGLAILSQLGRPDRGGSVSAWTIYAWFGLCIIGAVLCITGVVLRSQLDPKLITRGTALELAGLIFMFSGPFLLLVLYSYLTAAGTVRGLAAVGICYALCAAMVTRWMEVFPKKNPWRRDP